MQSELGINKILNVSVLGTILTANYAVQTHLQYTQDEVIGKSCGLFMDEMTARNHLKKGGYLDQLKSMGTGHQANGTSR
jgi:hypothetical protein